MVNLKTGESRGQDIWQVFSHPFNKFYLKAGWFSASGSADQGRSFSGFDFEGDIVEHLLLCAGRVGKIYIFELDFTINNLFGKSGASLTFGVYFGSPVDNFENWMGSDLTSSHKFQILANHA